MSRSRVTETSGHETRNPSFTSFDFTPARFMKPINGPAAENSQGKQVGLTIRRHIIFTVTVWPTSEYNSSKSDTLFRSENRIFPSPLNLYCSNEDSDKFEFGEHLNTRRQIPTMFKSGLERFREPYCFSRLKFQSPLLATMIYSHGNIRNDDKEMHKIGNCLAYVQTSASHFRAP